MGHFLLAVSVSAVASPQWEDLVGRGGEPLVWRGGPWVWPCALGLGGWCGQWRVLGFPLSSTILVV